MLIIIKIGASIKVVPTISNFTVSAIKANL